MKINLLSVAFWQLVQMVLFFAMSGIERRTGALSALAPQQAWEITLVLVVLANVGWTVAGIVYGSRDDAPATINLRRTVKSWLFPPPPAARRAYASRTKRQRRVIS